MQGCKRSCIAKFSLENIPWKQALCSSFWTSGDICLDKAKIDPSLACFTICMQLILQMHIWCHTCWYLGSHHDNWAIWSRYLHMCTCIDWTGTWDCMCQTVHYALIVWAQLRFSSLHLTEKGIVFHSWSQIKASAFLGGGGSSEIARSVVFLKLWKLLG